MTILKKDSLSSGKGQRNPRNPRSIGTPNQVFSIAAKRWRWERFMYRVIHQILQVGFFLNFCTIYKDIKLKVGIDDHQLLHHDIIKAKNNDSTIVSVMILLIVMSTRFAIKCGQSSRLMNLICSISYGLKTCISALKRSPNCQDYSTSHCGESKGNKWHGVSNLKRKSCSQMVFQFFKYPFGGAIF